MRRTRNRETTRARRASTCNVTYSLHLSIYHDSPFHPLQMRLLFSPNHVQLIAACYPPSASLLTSGPHYHPNAQELSRLTYYAANKPGKIQKLSGELQKRIKLEARKAHSNNPRSRA
jgi:hypothetical protein